MIKISIVFFMFVLNFAFASSLSDLQQLFNDNKFAQVCRKSGEMYQDNKDNEKFLNMFAASCLKTDMINRIVLPIIKLYRTKEARENSVYFTNFG